MSVEVDKRDSKDNPIKVGDLVDKREGYLMPENLPAIVHSISTDGEFIRLEGRSGKGGRYLPMFKFKKVAKGLNEIN